MSRTSSSLFRLSHELHIISAVNNLQAVAPTLMINSMAAINSVVKFKTALQTVAVRLSLSKMKNVSGDDESVVAVMT